MAENIRYAVSLQFLERLEKCGDINAVEKMKLKDVIEDVNGEPKVGDTLEMLRKKLRRMKVVENCDEPFSNSYSYYVENIDDNRSRRDRYNAKKFVRSDSRP